MEEEKTAPDAAQRSEQGTTMELQLAMDMLDEVQGLLEQMYDLAVRAAEDDCTDEERHALQGRLIILRERIDETVDAYQRLGAYHEAIYAAWKAADQLAGGIKS